MEKKKIFISQPMHGKSKSDILMDRARILDALKDQIGIPIESVEIVNNYEHKDVPLNAGRFWHLGKSIQQLETENVDFIVFPDDKTIAATRGCQIEKEIARQYNIPFIQLNVSCIG